MITLITAVPGSGKTLFSIGEILKYQEQGRQVYTNIDGLQIAGVRPVPDDWRDTPDGSVCIYDEAQQLYPNPATKGSSADPRVSGLETHRHTGHDLIFITQAPTLIHHHIRKLVGKHYHLFRPAGLQGANLYTWDFTCESPNDRREQERADHTFFKFNSKHYELYKSATVHTHKRRIPRKILILLGIIIPAGFFTAYQVSQISLITGSTYETTPDIPAKPSEAATMGQVAPVAANLSTSSHSWSKAAAVTPVAGCIASEKSCRCYDSEGYPLDIAVGACRSVVENPLPFKLFAPSKEEGSSSST